MAKKRLPALKRRQQILEKAARLFSEQGYSGTTIRKLAHNCRVNEAIIYKHFSSKRVLYDEVIKMEISSLDVMEYLHNLDRNRSIEQVFTEIARHILDIGVKNNVIQRLLLYGALEGRSSSSFLFITLRQPYVDFLANEIRQRMAKGEIRSVDPVITARSFVGMVMDCCASCALWCDFGYGNFIPEDTIANNAGIFSRGLTLQM
jgi:AcrR family transcriptional regulator